MPDKKTSPKAAKSASKVLKDGRTGKDSKAAAGSALSQKEANKPNNKKSAPRQRRGGERPGGSTPARSSAGLALFFATPTLHPPS